jgi:hypothetical protein
MLVRWPMIDWLKPRLLAAMMLATALLATGSVRAIEGIVAGGWSPDREAAVITGHQANADVAQYEEVISPAPAIANSRLMSRRPANLARPAPWERSFIMQEGAAEGLPAPRTPAGIPITPQGLPVPPGMYGHHSGEIVYGDCMDCQSCSGLCDGVNCDSCCGNWHSCGPAPICCLLPRLDCRSFELFAGVQGFTGPANRGGAGSFGFHEGFNWGGSACGCGAFQFGTNWTQSSFEGCLVTDDSRNQVFLTAAGSAGAIWACRAAWSSIGSATNGITRSTWSSSAAS